MSAATAEQEVASISAELQRVLADYWASVDCNDSEASPASFFAADGELVLGTLELRGRQELAAFFEKRRAADRANQRTTRHVSSDLRWRLAEPERVLARATVLVFSGTGAWPLPVKPPSAIGDFEFRLVRDRALGWHFERVVGVSVFVGEGAPSYATGR